MNHTMRRTAAIFLIFALCLTLTACSGAGSSKSASDEPDYGTYTVGEGVLKLRLVTEDPLYDGAFSGYQEEDGWLVLVFEPGEGRITFGDISDFSKCIRIDDCKYEHMSGTLGEEAPLSELSNTAISSDACVYYLFDAPADYTFSVDHLHIDAPLAE